MRARSLPVLAPGPPGALEPGASVTGWRFARGLVSALPSYASLAKPRVVGLVLLTAVATAFAAAGGVPVAPALALLVVSGLLVSGGAAALNHYFDRDVDRIMERTSQRPLAAGRIAHGEMVLALGTAAIAAGLGLAAVRPLMAAVLLGGAFVYVVVYTLWLKRRTPLNIVIGGAAGSLAVIAGWLAVAPDLHLGAVLLALLVFVWTPAHFWSLALVHAGDYQRAGIPMLPALVAPVKTAWLILGHVVLTVALALGVQPVLALGSLYLAAASAGGLAFLALGCWLLVRPGARAASVVFKFSGAYLALLFLAVLVDTTLS